MRNPINRRIPRELKKNFLKYAGMALILISTICVGTSFTVVLNAASDYLERIKEENLQEDGFFEVSSCLQDETVLHFAEDGINVYPNFYATENAYGGDSKILLFNERTQVDIPTVSDGRLPRDSDEIAIDGTFASHNDLAAGDSMTLLGKEYTIVGTVALPDYTSLFMNNTDLVMNNERFCVAVLSSSGFAGISEGSITYRYSYRFADRGLSTPDKTSAEEEMQIYLTSAGCTVSNFLPRSQNQSIAFLEADMGSDGPFVTVFVYMLVALIAFIFAILTNSTIEKESVIIGTLRASGYTKGEIIAHYLKPTVIVALAGSAAGNLLGYTVMIKPFLNMYYTSYCFGPLEIKFDIPMFLLTTILPVVIMVGINFWMMARKLSLSPLKFLRKELKRGKTKKPVKLPDINFIRKFRLRVIIQNSGSFIMLFIGVFLASFLLMFGIGLEPLVEHYSATVDESLPFEYEYVLKAPVDTDEGEKVFVYDFDTRFNLGNKDVSITCFGIESGSRYFGGACTENGVKLSSAAANKLGLDTGDTIKLKDSGTGKEYEFEVTGIHTYDAGLAVFIGRDTILEKLGMPEGTYNCILSDTKLDIAESCIAKQISRADLVGATEQLMSSFGTVIGAVNVFAVIVYIIMMYILTKVVIEKNALSISYLKVFGYADLEINRIFLTTTTAVVILSLIICIPLEALLFRFTLVFLSTMIEGYMSFYLPAWVYAAVIGTGLVTYLLISAANSVSIRKIPLSEALKNRE